MRALEGGCISSAFRVSLMRQEKLCFHALDDYFVVRTQLTVLQALNFD